MDDTKRCPKCGVTKPLEEFWRSKNGVQGRQGWCKTCLSPAIKSYAKAHPEVGAAAQRRSHTKKLAVRHGLTPEEVAVALATNECAICGQPETTTHGKRTRRLSFDHDHVTGRFRGFLCINCNAGVGQFKDDPKLLRRAARYVENHQSS